jgi:hypothetical protein
MAGTLDLSNVKWPEVMDLRTASFFLDLSEMRVRTLAREGGIPSSKDEEGNWAFKKADLQVYKDTPHVRKGGGGGGGPRADGKTWKIKVKFEDLEKVKAALGNFKIELKPAYDAEKMKASMARSKAKKAAEKAGGVKSPSVAKPATPVAPIKK